MSESNMILSPTTPDQQKRFASGMKAACTPLELFPADRRGTFSGGHGVYHTTLEDCDCVDFHVRRQPCKHMYRLAVELGVLEGTAVSDKTKIESPGLKKKQRLALLEAAVDKLEQVDLDSQNLFHEVLRDLFYRKKPHHKKRKSEDFSQLLAVGLVAEETPGYFIIPPEFKPAFKGLSLYLNRRNENEYYFDGDEFRSLPKGVHQAVAIEIGLNGSRVIDMTDFPDDEITALLNKYGVNRMAKKDQPQNK